MVVPAELLVAGGVLLVTLGAGTIAHELSHSIVLRVFGIPHEIKWLPAVHAGSITGTGGRPWATVTISRSNRGIRSIGLRLAAIAPFLLATPLLLIPVGIVPDPFATENVLAVAFAIGWFGCALPSPQDFSLLWYADQVVVDTE